MKIVELDIGGYRSLKSISWKPDALNILIGSNGSGKSNLLRMLDLISISAKGQLGKHVQQEGGMGAILWDGRAKDIYFRVTITSPKEDPDPEKHSQSYELTLERLGKSSGYRIEFELLDEFAKAGSNRPEVKRTILKRVGTEGELFHIDKEEGEGTLNAPADSIHDDKSLLSVAAGWLNQYPLIPLVQKYLSDWSVYHNFRVDVDAPIRQSTIARYEKRVDSDGQNLINVLHTLYTEDKEFKNDINLAMQAAFGDDFEELLFAPASDQRVQLKIQWKSLKRPQSAAALSDGTLRFLFLITVLASPNPPTLIAIDEPEAGLHPSMLPIIAEYADDASTRTQVILTTHSPEFLDAFREFDLQTTVFKCTDGETSLQVVDREKLRDWLQEYSLGSLQRSGELENTLVDLDD